MQTIRIKCQALFSRKKNDKMIKNECCQLQFWEESGATQAFRLMLRIEDQITLIPASILYKSIAGRYRPVSYPDGPITARYRFIKILTGM